MPKNHPAHSAEMTERTLPKPPTAAGIRRQQRYNGLNAACRPSRTLHSNVQVSRQLTHEGTQMCNE